MQARTFLITGASSGIGEQFARAYAARGCHLVLAARRLQRLEALATELSAQHGVVCTAIQADLGVPGGAQALLERLSAQGLQIDGLINNAGFSVAHTYAKSDWRHQAQFVELCVTTPSHLAHALLPGMIERGHGRIINVSSIVAFSPGATGHTLYPAAKAYILKFSRSLAAEAASKGVLVTALCPGSTESEFQHANGMKAAMAKKSVQMKGMPADIVVAAAIKANEAGREVIVTGLVNQIAVAAMTVLPDFIVTPLIRWGAQKFQMAE